VEYLQFPANSVFVPHASFYTVHDPKRKNPKLVLQIIGPTEGKTRYFGTSFYLDETLASIDQPLLTAYAGSGYHRGHCASAADLRELLLVVCTYLYTNILPMCPNFNRFVRLAMERYIRRLADAYQEVIVFHFPI